MGKTQVRLTAFAAGLQTKAIDARYRVDTFLRSLVQACTDGIAEAKKAAPPVGSHNGVDLMVLPKYISFRAALLREKLTLQHVLAAICVLFATYFAVSRYEVHSLQEALRQKEYILAPGVLDFIPASPQTVPDRYVEAATMDFLVQLGNVNAVNIDEQYAALSAFMSPELKMRFELEAAEWKNEVKGEGLTEAMTVINKRIESDGSGRYRVVAEARTQTFVKAEHVGSRDEVIEMELRLVPPKDGKRWFLEISKLSRGSTAGYRESEPIKRGGKHE